MRAAPDQNSQVERSAGGMARRDFLRFLVLAPVAAPFAAKEIGAMAATNYGSLAVSLSSFSFGAGDWKPFTIDWANAGWISTKDRLRREDAMVDPTAVIRHLTDDISETLDTAVNAATKAVDVAGRVGELTTKTAEEAVTAIVVNEPADAAAPAEIAA